MKRFDKKALYALLKRIPKGSVTTYGALARALGNAAWARAVGNALHQNPDGDRYPCYRVVNGRGELSPAYAFGGLEEQKRRLEADGVTVRNGRVDLKKYSAEITTGADNGDLQTKALHSR